MDRLCKEVLACVTLEGVRQLAQDRLHQLKQARPVARVRPYSPDKDRRLAYEDEIGEDGLTRRERRILDAEEIERQLADI